MSLAKRIVVDVLLFASILWLPWWCAALVAFGATFIFDWYYEVVVAGFIADSLYGVPNARFHGFMFVATGISIILFFAALYARPKIRLYK